MKLVKCFVRLALLAAILAGAASCLVAADSLPLTPAETLSGEKLEFPAALAHKTAVCVFGFSKEAGDRTKVWMTRLSQDRINAWSVANLEKAPGLVRGMIRGSMRRGTPEVQLSHSLVMTKNEKAWRQALGVKQDGMPVVILLDPAGNIVWAYEGEFGDEPYRQLKSKFENTSPK